MHFNEIIQFVSFNGQKNMLVNKSNYRTYRYNCFNDIPRARQWRLYAEKGDID